MSIVAVIYVCAGVLAAFRVLERPFKRYGIKEWAAALCLFAAAAILLFSPKLSRGSFTAGAPFALSLLALILLIALSRGEYMGLRTVAVIAFAAVVYFLSLFAIEFLSYRAIPPVTVALCVLYCVLLSPDPLSALVLTMTCVWAQQLTGGAYEAIANGYVYFDLSSASCAAYGGGLAAFVLKDMLCLLRARLTKRAG